MSEGDALRQVFAEFGIKWDDKALAKGAQTVEGVIGQVRALGALVVGSELVSGIRQFAAEFEEAAGTIQDAAGVMGVTTTELQELQRAGVAAGLSAERSSAALSHLQQASADAATGAKGPASAFRALGVQLKNTDGSVRSTGDLMDDLAVNFATIQDPTRRAQLAQDLFGRSGARMVNVLHEGEGGLAAVRAELAELGGGIFPEAIEAADDYGDATDRMKVATDSFRSVIAVGLLPILTWLVSRGTDVVAWLSRMTRGTHVAQLAIAALGTTGAVAGAKMLLAWLPVIGPFLFWAAIAAEVVLIVDDLITTLEGGDSVTRRFVDGMFGIGTTEATIRGIRDLWNETGESISAAVEAVRSFGESQEETQRRHQEEALDRAAVAAERARLALAPGEGYEGTETAPRGAKREPRSTERAVPLPMFRGTAVSSVAVQAPEYAATEHARALASSGHKVNVAAPASVASGGGVTQHIDRRISIGAIHSNATDSRRVAAEVLRELEARMDTERDEAHPVGAVEG